MSSLKLTDIKGVGEKRARLFNKLGVNDVDALLYYYPRDYLDLSSPCSPADAPFGEPCAVKAEVITPPVEHRIRKGMTVYKFTTAGDGTALRITLFNQKYAAAKIHTGQTYIFYGVVGGNMFNREMSSPEIITADSACIRPIYHACEGLPSSVIESAIKNALDLADGTEDPIPDYLISKYHLLPLKSALKNIHFPSSMELLSTARRRLMFQELLLLQCGIFCMKSENKRTQKSDITDYSADFEKLIPYSLTGAQKKSIAESVSDMMSDTPMNRLLQGDVGSGKTAVAASLCYTAVRSGYQAAFMAPTEILAEQHYNSLCKLFANTDIQIGLLTGSTPKKASVIKQIENGELDLVIGTHALIEDRITFNKLKLIITDEQHRFGVEQRSRLIAKGDCPNILVMSATPIPRTLALMIYGDLDISVLDELPPGRLPVITRHVKSEAKPKVYDFIKSQIDTGRQAYIVCPLVESNESVLTPATEYCDHLSKTIFGNYRLGLLHGKMSSAQKETVMREFSKGSIDILVSTTVIEVGVDVPNASVILIENAERFGLSQLHQLRGRVGRGKHKSYCIMVSDVQNEISLGRINEMCSTNDGFKIAEYDLKSRGPGDFFGHRQHGLPPLKLTDFMTDFKAVAFSQEVAKQICTDDPQLEREEHQSLKRAVIKMFDAAGGVLN